MDTKERVVVPAELQFLVTVSREAPTASRLWASKSESWHLIVNEAPSSSKVQPSPPVSGYELQPVTSGSSHP